MTTLTVGGTVIDIKESRRAKALPHRQPNSSLAARIPRVADTLLIGGELEVRRLGLGAMSLTGPGVWGRRRGPTRRGACSGERSSWA